MENTDPSGSQTQTSASDSDKEAFIARARSLYEKLGTAGTDLRELYDAGQTERVDEMLDEMATDLLMEDPEFTQNISSIRQLRNYNLKNPAAEAEIVSRNKTLLKTYRDLIVMESGLPDEARLGEIEAAKKAIAEQLSDKGYAGGDPVEALHILGIISEEDGKVIYTFPESLVPESVTDKWNIYLTSVIEHLASVKALETGHGNQASVAEADRIRTYSHNAITADVHNVLGLEGDKGWAFKNTRQLLADTRDYVLSDDILTSEDVMDKYRRDNHRGFVASAALSKYKH